MKTKTIAVSLLFLMTLISCSESQTGLADRKKTEDIASLIQKTVNVGGYDGCRTRVIDKGLIQCDLKFPLGTSPLTVLTNTRGVAESLSQVRLAATIYYAGYAGDLKVCEFKFDPLKSSLDRVK
jgi:hypothetical protein